MTTLLRRIIFLVIIAVIWEAVYNLTTVPDFMFPSIFSILKTFFEGIISFTFLKAVGLSLGRLLLGFLIAICLGFFFGFLIWYSKLVEDTLGFLVTALQSIPSIVWFPLAIVWFGLNEKAILFIVTIGATWTMIISVASGFKNVPQLYQRVARTFGSKRFHFIRTVIIPASIPHLISGLRIAWAFSWRALMAGELLAASGGLGELLDRGRSLGQMDLVISIMLIIAIIGIIMDRFVFARIEKSIERKWGLKSVA